MHEAAAAVALQEVVEARLLLLAAHTAHAMSPALRTPQAPCVGCGAELLPSNTRAARKDAVHISSALEWQHGVA